MSDDDIDDKKPVRIVSTKSCKSKNIKDSDSDSDDDNIEIHQKSKKLDDRLRDARTEIILNADISKNNDDSDKSSDKSSDNVWIGVPRDLSDGVVDDQDVDDILNDMKSNIFHDNNNIEPQLDELSSKVDNLEESISQLTEKVDKILKLLKKVLDTVNASSGTTIIMEGTKKSIVDGNDVHDPVNNLGYFDK